MAYSPNIRDPRVLKRIRTALGWAQSTLRTHKEREVPKTIITKYLGNQAQDLGRWLKSKLLTVSDHHYSMVHGDCKKYLLNSAGYEEVKQLLGRDSQRLSREWVEQQFTEEVQSGNFEYVDKSSRLWHPLQNVKGEIRDQFLADHGMPHNYDIECAAPTLIYQSAIFAGLERNCHTIKQYTEDRKRIRAQLSQATGISEDTIKTVINAMFAGAQVGLNRRSRVYQDVNNHEQMKLLKDHSIIRKLKREIKTCWDAIRPTLDVPQRLDCRIKSAHYRSLERLVLNSVKEFLDLSEIKYMTIHDGWVTASEIDIVLLENYIKQTTGYSVRIEYSCL